MLCHFIQSHIRRAHACLAVTCHLHFWQDDRDRLRAPMNQVKSSWKGRIPGNSRSIQNGNRACRLSGRGGRLWSVNNNNTEMLTRITPKWEKVGVIAVVTLYRTRNLFNIILCRNLRVFLYFVFLLISSSLTQVILDWYYSIIMSINCTNTTTDFSCRREQFTISQRWNCIHHPVAILGKKQYSPPCSYIELFFFFLFFFSFLFTSL